MAEKKSGKGDKESWGDKLGKKVYGDADDYDWAGQKTGDGWDKRKKGTDGP